MLKVEWKSKGRFLEPNKKIWWMSKYTGSSAITINRNKVILYVSGRADDGKSRIGKIILKWVNGKPKILKIYKKPIINIPKKNAGHFYTDGALYPEPIKIKKKELIYFAGWLNQKTIKYNCQIGFAKKYKNKFLIQNYPLFSLNKIDSVGTGSLCIVYFKKKYFMYYTSFDPWKKIKNKFIHNYYLKIAISVDGLNWNRINKIALPLKRGEVALAKPSAIVIDNKIYLCFSARKKNYNIFSAISNDGLNFYRNKKKINLRSGIWDDKSQEYPYIFKIKDKIYMLYNGNNYGKTGIGYAEAKIIR